MEPLTAFFIFEGLVFDIIGTILIVSGILNMNPKLSPELTQSNAMILSTKVDIDNLQNRMKTIKDSIVPEPKIRYNTSMYGITQAFSTTSHKEVPFDHTQYLQDLKTAQDNRTKKGKLQTLNNKIIQERLNLDDMAKRWWINYLSYEFTRRGNYASVRGFKGLFFLVGGFLLQIIGIINQLV